MSLAEALGTTVHERDAAQDALADTLLDLCLDEVAQGRLSRAELPERMAALMRTATGTRLADYIPKDDQPAAPIPLDGTGASLHTMVAEPETR